jgi:CheY-like chemotaxis protein/HPt (histidine-containing phosphotransfer) domain-containing protein
MREKMVLVIDDEADARMLAAQVVREVGCRVLSAPSGEWGLELARLNRPDLVLLDLLMPRMSGWDVAARLREDPHLKDVPVVVVSIAAAENRGSIRGVADYMNKPVVPEELKAIVRRSLQPRRGKILVIDDEKFVQELLCYALSEKGAEVRTANHGQEALKLLPDYQPDMIILDLMMPVMGGMAFLDALRKNPRFAATPVVVLTGKLLSAAEVESLRASGVSVMIKGERLETLIQEVLSRLPERRRRPRRERTVVHVPPKLAQLVPGFLKNRRSDVEAIRRALQQGDYPTIQRLGHQLKGAGGGYGFVALTEIGGRLESAAVGRDAEQLAGALSALATYLESVDVVYQ